MPLRPTLSMLVLVALSVSPTVRLSGQADPDRAVAGGGSVPTGYHARTDRNAPLTNVKVAAMGTGMHFTLGPAVIVWRDVDAVGVVGLRVNHNLDVHVGPLGVHKM